MFGLTRETLLMAGFFLAMLAVVYLYKKLNKTKKELEEARLPKPVSETLVCDMKKPALKKVVKVKEEPEIIEEKDSEEIVDEE
jgi:preprotein translocase subunit SecG